MDNPIRTLISADMRDALIVGGGLTGPLMAIALAQAGMRVTVIDALAEKVRKNVAFDGRSYAVALSSCRMLRALGLWDALAPTAQPILDIKVSDGRAGQGPSPFFMHFDHAELEEGSMGHMIEDRFLRHTLLDRIAGHTNITHVEKRRVIAEGITPSGITAHLDDGTEIAAQVLLAADGRRSEVAERAGIRRIKRDYGQTALVCAVAHERPHNGTAHQFFMPPGPLAILPLTQNRSSIVWSETADHAAEIHAMADDAYIRMLQPRFGSFLGDIALAGRRYTYPLTLSLARRMVAPRVALVGDAAHGVHPIAGQGLNAGMRDIAALVQVLQEARQRGEDIGAETVLARYETWRRFDNTALAFATDSFNRLFSNDVPLVRAARDIGMGVVNALPMLRRGFMREAAGLTGELPALMR